MITATVHATSSIRRHATRAVATVLTLCSLCPLASLAQDRVLAKAQIPFAFSASKDILPAGEYRLVQVTASMYQLQSIDGHHSTFFTGMNLDAPKNPSRGRLMFHAYGDRYFLQSAWSGTSGQGMKLSTRAEEKKYAARMIAAQQAPVDTVIAMQTGMAKP